MKRFDGKVCIVTASATGIGLAIARKLGLEGGKIVISSRNSENVLKAVNGLKKEGITCEGIVCHVSKDRKKLIAFAIEKFGKIDILVNNAAVSTHFGPSLDITEEAYDKMLDVNVKAGFFLTKEAAPYLKQTQGKVVFVSSVAGYVPNAAIGVYGMTKTALLSLTKSLAIELAGHKVRVNGIAPGIIKTKFAKSLEDTDDVKNNPSGRIGYPEDCAGAVAFLCSEEADYITGETIVISGGYPIRL
jgi:dehydrogenase/reductase SDR family member 4